MASRSDRNDILGQLENTLRAQDTPLLELYNRHDTDPPKGSTSDNVASELQKFSFL